MLGRDGPLQVVHPAGHGPVRGGAAAKQGATGVQRHAHDKEEHQDDGNGLEGYCHGGAVGDRCRVDDNEGGKDDGGHEQALVDHCPLPMLAPKHAEDAPALVAACNDGDEVGYHKRGCRGAALSIVRIGNCEEKHDEHRQRQVNARGIQDGKDGKVFGPAEYVPIDLLPAAFVAAPVHALQLLSISGRVAREVLLQRLHEDYRYDRTEEEAEHEGVHNRKPMNLMLKELGVKVPHRPILEGLVRRAPR
mmetsp:Transcript_76337/g.247203  ORF Transcript_76337/g.247203 Transcript_76337/m.247203 type:complete len:248 (-) Transcript_76337:812-1555(-)